ncbi:MAG TPA: hypothetical protein VJV74_11210, partial [Terriglobia bacterium]|nr:hypothetical protein [Terriglobia bacterium]
SSGYASGLEHSPNASVHFFFFDQLSAVGLLDALPHRSPKPGVFLQQFKSCISHQLLGILACLGGDFGELGLLLGREIHFHGLSLGYA